MEENFEELENYIEEFYLVKNEADKYKKLADEDNKQIKDLMSKLDTDLYTTENGLQAKITIQNRESFNEAKLVQTLKELGATTAIKTIEVPDMDEIENLIYNGQLDASKLTDCKETKQVTTLKVSKKKGE